jgi:hypothetical protein
MLIMIWVIVLSGGQHHGDHGQTLYPFRFVLVADYCLMIACCGSSSWYQSSHSIIAVDSALHTTVVRLVFACWCTAAGVLLLHADVIAHGRSRLRRRGNRRMFITIILDTCW